MLTFFSKFSEAEEVFANKDEAIESAIKNIERFASVGVLENIGLWEKRFNKKFGVKIKVGSKNTTPNNNETKKILGDSAIMKKVRELTEVDRAIYDIVLSKE